MGLNIRIITSEQFLCSLSCKFLNYINTVASAVISLSRISFRILIGKGASHCCHNRLAYPVLGSDKLDMAVLTLLFFYNGLSNFGVDCSEFF